MEMQRLAPAALGAWLVTLLVAMAGAIGIAAAHDSSSIGELAVMYVPVMSVPFAAGTGMVLVPLMSCARAVAGPDRPWLLGSVGVIAAPVQGMALLIAGRMLFHGSPHVRATLAADLAAQIAHPADAAGLLVAFAAGGLVLGAWAARPSDSTAPLDDTDRPCCR